jgi:hypothetical protein
VNNSARSLFLPLPTAFGDFFTGGQYFKLKEIEDFEIGD